MASRAKPNRKKQAPPGSRKNLTLVVLAGLLLVIWGFVLGVLVGRGTVPTIIPDRLVADREDRPTASEDRARTVATTSTTTAPAASATTITARPLPTTTLGFYEDLSEETAETLPPLPPPTTLRAPSVKKADKPLAGSKTGPKSDASKPAREKPKKKKAPAAKPAKAVYELQVAAFPSRPEAETEASRVARKTEHRVRVVVSQVKGRTWYRVRVGGFATRREAQTAARSLERAGLDSLLVNAAP